MHELIPTVILHTHFASESIVRNQRSLKHHSCWWQFCKVYLCHGHFECSLLTDILSTVLHPPPRFHSSPSLVYLIPPQGPLEKHSGTFLVALHDRTLLHAHSSWLPGRRASALSEPTADLICHRRQFCYSQYVREAFSAVYLLCAEGIPTQMASWTFFSPAHNKPMQTAEQNKNKILTPVGVLIYWHHPARDVWGDRVRCC